VFEVDLPESRVVFTTREGGASQGPFSSRNLGLATEDDPATVFDNLSQLKSELGITSLQTLDQHHGAQIHELTSATVGARPRADGATTTEAGTGILITGADCPTVVLASPTRLTALHCGWRPVAGGIVEAAACAFDHSGFDAVIGPGICQEHFEVGPEVVAALGPDGDQFSNGRQLDLVALVAARLRRGGARGVRVVERCTYCEPELFFSHRRDGGTTGRQAGVAWRI
jgi:YfiH family protein